MRLNNADSTSIDIDAPTDDRFCRTNEFVATLLLLLLLLLDAEDFSAAVEVVVGTTLCTLPIHDAATSPPFATAPNAACS